MNNVYQASRRVVRRVKDGGSSAARILTGKINGVIAGAREFWAQRQAANNVIVSAPQIDIQDRSAVSERRKLLAATINAKQLVKSQKPGAVEALQKLAVDLQSWADWLNYRDVPVRLARDALANLNDDDDDLKAIAQLDQILAYLSHMSIESTVVPYTPPPLALRKIEAFIADLTAIQKEMNKSGEWEVADLQRQIQDICDAHDDEEQSERVQFRIADFEVHALRETAKLNRGELKDRLGKFIAKLESGSESNSSTEDDSSSGGSLDFS